MQEWQIAYAERQERKVTFKYHIQVCRMTKASNFYLSRTIDILNLISCQSSIRVILKWKKLQGMNRIIHAYPN